MQSYEVDGPKGGPIIKRAPLARVRALLPALVRRFGELQIRAGRPAPQPGAVTMYDSITVSEIPGKAQAVAGYVNGRWPTFPLLAREFPRAHRLSIAVTADHDADCLDVEQGDARPDQAAAWVKRQFALGVRRPVVYTSVSQAPTVLAALSRAGVDRTQIRLWTAHYSYRPHRCTRLCGFGFEDIADATQYDDKALGRNLDASLCSPTFFT